MAKGKFSMRLGLTVGLCVLVGLPTWSVALRAEEPITIAKSEEYFPDSVGSRWTYRGQVLPSDAEVQVQATVSAWDDAARVVTADGWLSVDGRVIYRMQDFSLRLG